MSVARQPAGHCLIQHQRHEDVVRHVPLAGDTQRSGAREAESWIELRVSDNEDERTSNLLHPGVARLYQFAADALTLVVRKNGHRAKCRALNAADDDRTVENVADDTPAGGRHKGQQHAIVVAQRVNHVALLFLAERAAVHFLNRPDVAWLLVTNHYWHDDAVTTLA